MDRSNFSELEPHEQTDLQTFAAAAMSSLIGSATSTLAGMERIDRVQIAEEAWQIAEAMIQRRNHRTFSLREERPE